MITFRVYGLTWEMISSSVSVFPLISDRNFVAVILSGRSNLNLQEFLSTAIVKLSKKSDKG